MEVLLEADLGLSNVGEPVVELRARAFVGADPDDCVDPKQCVDLGLRARLGRIHHFVDEKLGKAPILEHGAKRGGVVRPFQSILPLPRNEE